ncbi:MAG: ferredoxin [Candidatus Methylomirabilales bacterium]
MRVLGSIFIRVEVNDPKCLGMKECGECVRVCPVNIFYPEGDRIGVQEEDECILCNLCLTCPTDAIRILRLYDGESEVQPKGS